MNSQELTLAIDAMGGDHAPHAVVKGAAIALRLDADLRLILVGDAGKLRPYWLAKALATAPRIVHYRCRGGFRGNPIPSLAFGQKFIHASGA